MLYQLAYCGYGSVAGLQKMPAGEVMDIWHYECFRHSYKQAFIEANRQG
ncbi:MAG: hypothetical protein FWE37_01080 [Spirochaetaceae bacterium]|nr:hypothetical protein [Spirochaetaceae bacterium]